MRLGHRVPALAVVFGVGVLRATRRGRRARLWRRTGGARDARGTPRGDSRPRESLPAPAVVVVRRRRRGKPGVHELQSRHMPPRADAIEAAAVSMEDADNDRLNGRPLPTGTKVHVPTGGGGRLCRLHSSSLVGGRHRWARQHQHGLSDELKALPGGECDGRLHHPGSGRGSLHASLRTSCGSQDRRQ